LQANAWQLERVAETLNATQEEVENKLVALQARVQEQEKELARLRGEQSRREAEKLLGQVKKVKGVNVLAVQVDAANADALRELSDWFRDKLGSGVVVLGAAINGAPSLIAAVTPDLVEKGFDAVKIIRDVARVVGGGGGGRPTLAQAGGKDASKLKDALELVPGLIEKL